MLTHYDYNITRLTEKGKTVQDQGGVNVATPIDALALALDRTQTGGKLLRAVINDGKRDLFTLESALATTMAYAQKEMGADVEVRSDGVYVNGTLVPLQKSDFTVQDALHKKSGQPIPEEVKKYL